MPTQHVTHLSVDQVRRKYILTVTIRSQTVHHGLLHQINLKQLTAPCGQTAKLRWSMTGDREGGETGEGPDRWRRRLYRQHDRVGLLGCGIAPVILDSLVRHRREFSAERAFYEGDICDGRRVDRVFAQSPDIDAVIHCAALIWFRTRWPTRSG